MPSDARLNSLLRRNENSLDFVRFAAAIAVIFSHAFPLSYGADFELNDPIVRLTNSQNTTGGLAVAIFFIISGFLISASMVQSQSAWAYVKGRFLRIYPAFIVVVLLSIFVLGPFVTTLSLQNYLSNPDTLQYSKILLLNGAPNLPGVFTTNAYQPPAINGSLWTLFWEILCYLLVLLFWLTRSLKKRFMLALWIGLLSFDLILYTLLPTVLNAGIHTHFLDVIQAIFHTDFFFNSTHLILLFFSGTVFYLYRNQIVMKLRYVQVGILVLLISILLGTGLMTLWFPTFGAYTLFYAASSARSPFKSFGKRGDFSYGVYIYAFPTQQTLTHFFGGTMLPMVNFVLAVPITLVFAVLSWHLVEKPALKLKHFSLRRGAKTSAATV